MGAKPVAALWQNAPPDFAGRDGATGAHGREHQTRLQTSYMLVRAEE